MVVLKTQSEFGHAPPPQTPYSIITNLPGWDLTHDLREGNMEPMSRVVHIYPRFMPTHAAAKLSQEIAKTLGMESMGARMYLNPVMWPYTRGHATNKRREEHVMNHEDLTFKVVDVLGHRLYVVLFNPAQTMGMFATWGLPGLGISIRGAEELLKGLDTMIEVPGDFDHPPEPTWTPETEAHTGLRERITELVHRAAIDPAKVKCEPKDVFLYPTGMGAIFHTTRTALAYRPGTAVVMGVVFHNTYHHLLEETPLGWKHVGKVDEAAVDGMEAWLEQETQAGRKVSFVLVEYPGNPTLDSVDLVRVKKLSEKYGFVFIVDDTLGGFGNIDVLAQSDILLTSLTKSFSGRSDVLGGSIVLNQLSPKYADLSTAFTTSHHNELFAADAAVLLANSQDFLARTRRLNRNAEAMASFFVRYVDDPESPVVNVQYLKNLPSKPLYDAFLRRSTPELPEPGYGCLLTVDFESVETARAFYDSCGFYPSPHLGGHVTIMFSYNMFVFGKDPAERAYFRTIGVKEESVRFSAGLEDVEDLMDTVKAALDVATAVKRGDPPKEATS